MKPAIAGVLMHPIKNSAPVVKIARRICSILEISILKSPAWWSGSNRLPAVLDLRTRFAPRLQHLTCQAGEKHLQTKYYDNSDWSGMAQIVNSTDTLTPRNPDANEASPPFGRLFFR
jgi:hypothetical protein